MVEMTKKQGSTAESHWWWFDSHNTSPCSPWLQSAVSDLDKKTKGFLQLIEPDADSFAQRAEMYYRKRPELICMVEDFYRTHRSLAERYDQLKSESGSRVAATLGSPFSAKFQTRKFMGGMDQAYESHSEAYDLEDSAESEVDDPEPDIETLPDEDLGEIEDPEPVEVEPVEEMGEIDDAGDAKAGKVGGVCNEEVMKLKEEIERLKEENRIQKYQLLQKDEEKREVIRQLSSAMEVLKLENMKMRQFLARVLPKKRNLFEFGKLKEVFSFNFFNGSSKDRAIAL